MDKISVSIIGSFKQFYSEIVQIKKIFEKNDFKINSPLGNHILKVGIPFVRFDSDDKEYSDELIQTVTLERIFSSAAVYVYTPKGYIGRTTCYEVGRIIQKRQPIYFSEHPVDLPINVPNDFVVSPDEFVNIVKSNNRKWLYDNSSNKLSELENKIA